MTIQTKILSNLEMTISAEALEKTQFLLKSLGFDLFEMWQHDSGLCYEIWKSEKNSVRVNISQDLSQKDASRSDIVEEIDYLYWELRAIKNILIDHVYEPDVEDLGIEKTPQQEFAEAVASVKDLDAFEDSEKTFLFKKHVDPILIAYLSMDQDQRKAIQQ